VTYAKVMEGNQTNKTCNFDNQMSCTNQEDERTANKEKPQTKQGIVLNIAQTSKQISN